ncbi:MAG: hypothetical protein H6738_10540 [Alphaproteobacteria bacterium]|nr:hypothetical protein [Alphaproteobacteria bacterium]MCB9697207.1 hypothetical protein [Alphaproteobacteria bacterium]
METVGEHDTTDSLTFRVGGVSDGGRTTLQPLRHVGPAEVLYVASDMDDAGLAVVGQALSEALRDAPETPQQLRLTLLRLTRTLRPRPRSLAVVWWSGSRALLASTGGASVALVRAGRVVGHCGDAEEQTLREGDRVALVCHELDERLRDAEELGRLVGEGPVGACGTTLVDVGRLRGGELLSAVVAEVAPVDAPHPALAEGFLDLADLLAPLRTPPPTAPRIEAEPESWDMFGDEDISLVVGEEDPARLGPVPSLTLSLPAPSLAAHPSPVRRYEEPAEAPPSGADAELPTLRPPPFLLAACAVLAATALMVVSWVLVT